MMNLIVIPLMLYRWLDMIPYRMVCLATSRSGRQYDDHFGITPSLGNIKKISRKEIAPIMIPIA